MSEDLFGMPADPEDDAADEDIPSGFSLFDDDGGPSLAVSPAAKTGLLPPYENPDLLGFEGIEQDLLKLWNAHKFPHAIALNGPRGIGKSTLAFRLARFILHNSDHDNGAGGLLMTDAPATSLSIPLSSRSFTQTASGGHPDFKAYGEFYGVAMDEKKKTEGAGIETIRGIEKRLRNKGAYGAWRIVIVDDADLMTKQAQNGILKILEEPPSNSLLILVAHRMNLLLPTIRSRLRVVKCPPLPDDTVKTLLRREDPSIMPEDLDILAFAAQGSVGRALDILRNGGAQEMIEVLSFIARLPTMTPIETATFCEAMSGADANTRVARWQAYVLWAVERIASGKGRGVAPFDRLNLQDNFTLRMALESFMDKGSVQDWLNGLEQLNSHFGECEARYLDNYYRVQGAIKILKTITAQDKAAA